MCKLKDFFNKQQSFYYELCIMNCTLFYKNCTIDCAKCLFSHHENNSFQKYRFYEFLPSESS